MKNKWLKTIIVAITIIPWSIVIILFLQIKNIFFQQPKVKTVSVVKVADTITNKQPKFFSQTPQEGLREALVYYDLEHRDIIHAQAILETGYFKSDLCLNNNNLFGLYNSKEKKYYKFNHWAESVMAYKEWIQNKYNPPNNYYEFLLNIGYAKDPNYINKLKRIVNKNDERRSK